VTRRHLALFLLVVVALSFGCRRRGSPSVDSAAAAAGKALGLPPAGFRPPADGVLTEEQVARFLRVRRGAKGRTDAESAQALGASPEEIAWIRGRVIEALVALDDRRVREATQETYARAIASLRATRAAVRDPARAKSLDQDIAVLERERASVRREETPSSALAANMRRVAPRRADLAAAMP